ncbi:hypothetical protein HOLleu_17916 [Holothuria leucospilota]|uniref:Uncharacterized protein n=1 Tax=Holothuria leucospilota TaxID=206669 RepID=A0A9Q1H973_HOLLE|nr:hypothetical protein HOLleu_17916 [Holothuria leucospilota]
MHNLYSHFAVQSTSFSSVNVVVIDQSELLTKIWKCSVIVPTFMSNITIGHNLRGVNDVTESIYILGLPGSPFKEKNARSDLILLVPFNSSCFLISRASGTAGMRAYQQVSV